jgi:hypothetical protein
MGVAAPEKYGPLNLKWEVGAGGTASKRQTAEGFKWRDSRMGIYVKVPAPWLMLRGHLRSRNEWSLELHISTTINYNKIW